MSWLNASVTTGCKSKVCGCKRKETHCSQGCQCTSTDNCLMSRTTESRTMLEEEAVMNSTDEDGFADFVSAVACGDSNNELENSEH